MCTSNTIKKLLPLKYIFICFKSVYLSFICLLYVVSAVHKNMEWNCENFARIARKSECCRLRPLYILYHFYALYILYACRATVIYIISKLNQHYSVYVCYELRPARYMETFNKIKERRELLVSMLMFQL